MSASQVTYIRPRLEPFEAAISAYRAAEFTDCLRVLSTHSGPAATALRARALLRVGRPADALEETGFALAADLPEHFASELLILRATALVQLSRFSEAEEVLVEGRVRAYLSGSAELEADAEFTTAQMHWSAYRFDDARASIRRTLAVEAPRDRWFGASSNFYLKPLTESRARAYDLLGLIAAADEAYDEQARLEIAALEELASLPDADPFLVAGLLTNLAVLVRELDAPELHTFLRSRVAALKFTEGTKGYEFHIRRSLGTRSALLGDHLGALREFRLSADAAPTVGLRMVAILDRVALAREIGEQTCAQEELEFALRLSKSVNWESAHVQDRFPLMLLARELAYENAGAARKLLDVYLRFKSPLPPTEVGGHDRRLHAEDACAQAAVLRAEGESQRATSLLLDAFKVFSEIGYCWRAALVAADLVELTGEDKYREYAERQANSRPNSWLTRRLRAAALQTATAG